ncbi:CapA family protein [Solibacillus sp. FSL R5-0691]|uniref:CapA family protein n=1 Tax=Solibacillus sp. FSL R5-0691 TaxID=2921653 RepID=UPI0030D029EB
MNNLNKFLLALWAVSLTLLFIVIATADQDPPILVAEGQMTTEENNPPEIKLENDLNETDKPISKPKDQVTKESIRLAMTGDVLLHLRLAKYDEYTSSFAAVMPKMQSYDFLIANQESPPVGNEYPLSGYPRFSSPAHIIRDLQHAGVDLVTIANNHIVDQGEKGMRTVFNNLEDYHMPYVGAYKNKEDQSAQRIIEIGSIKIGLLAYTYGTNGLYLPKESPLLINYMDEAKIKADVEELKKTVDVVAVSMHWGSEYVYAADDNQKYYADILNKAGVDIIFGTHPHVLQPYDKLTNEQGQETHIFYSLGNFFSTILTIPNTMIGGIASLDITKEGDRITIDKPELYATSVLKDADGIYRVYPLKDVEQRSVKNLQWVKKIMGQSVTVY